MIRRLLKSYFITATDTGIGKTSVTAALAASLRSDGVDVGVMKPFACGEPKKSGFKSEDVEILCKYAQTHDAEELVNPYFFPIPASPYSAAAKLGAKIDVNLVLQKFEKLQSLHDLVLVEGIGGILTPILKDYKIVDLIKDLDLQTIIVTSSKIGTINHTLLTCEMCKKYGLSLRGIVINGSNEPSYDNKDLIQDISHLSGVEILGTIPHLDVFDISKISQLVKPIVQKIMF